MTNRDRILNELRQLPDPLLPEVLDFVEFLKKKISMEKSEVTTLSETSLKKDWLRPEEDMAWQHL